MEKATIFQQNLNINPCLLIERKNSNTAVFRGRFHSPGDILEFIFESLRCLPVWRFGDRRRGGKKFILSCVHPAGHSIGRGPVTLIHFFNGINQRCQSRWESSKSDNIQIDATAKSIAVKPLYDIARAEAWIHRSPKGPWNYEIILKRAQVGEYWAGIHQHQASQPAPVNAFDFCY